MSNSYYGVLVGKVIEIMADPDSDRTPHYSIFIKSENDEEYEALINCRSRDKNKPRVMYYLDEKCQNKLREKIENLNIGFHKIDYANDINSNIAIDYLRGALFNPKELKTLEYDIEGENDLKGHIDKNMKKALNNEQALIYVFGTYFDSDGRKGMHNIHMNQGNRATHSQENKIYHDGCVFINFLAEERCVAYYFAFENQSKNTNEDGNPQD